MTQEKAVAKNVKSYFEHHTHDYANRHTHFYPLIAKYLKNIVITRGHRLKLLDLGCGDGGFVKAMLEANVKIDYFATDMSFGMMKLAKENFTDYNVGLFVADGFNIPVKDDIKFDIIHLDSVLHHLVDKTRGKSVDRVKRMIESLVSKLSDGGIIIIEEWHLVSHIIPTFTAFLIFYGLKLINLLGIDLSFTREIRLGLEVNFLDQQQLSQILARHGEVYLFDKVKVEFPSTYRAFMLREKDHSTFILKVCKNG